MSDVPMSADVLVANLRPLAAEGNVLAQTYIAVIEAAPNREAAAQAVVWSWGRLVEALAEIADAAAPLVLTITDLMGPN